MATTERPTAEQVDVLGKMLARRYFLYRNGRFWCLYAASGTGGGNIDVSSTVIRPMLDAAWIEPLTKDAPNYRVTTAGLEAVKSARSTP